MVGTPRKGRVFILHESSTHGEERGGKQKKPVCHQPVPDLLLAWCLSSWQVFCCIFLPEDVLGGGLRGWFSIEVSLCAIRKAEDG